jgi:hypothetical protein
VNRFVFANAATGEIVRVTTCPDDQAVPLDGEVVVQHDTATPRTHHVASGELVAYTPEQQAAKAQPQAVNAVWSNASFSWIDGRPLEVAKAAKKLAIDAERARRTELPIDYVGSLFDADGTAQDNVRTWQIQLGAGATLPEGFVWRDADNVDHPADADFVNGLGVEMTMRGTQLYMQAWALKAQVDDATTIPEVEAITWDS